MKTLKNIFYIYLCFLISVTTSCFGGIKDSAYTSSKELVETALSTSDFSNSLAECLSGEADALEVRVPQGQRFPKGFGMSPYSFLPTLRFGFNYVTGGAWSYKNPDLQDKKPLPYHGVCRMGSKPCLKRPYKMLFIGDYMVDASGKCSVVSDELKKLFKSANVVVVNVEAPVVDVKSGGGSSAALKFEMESSYLKELYTLNPDAQWVFGIANNHACDTSMGSSTDISGIVATTQAIKKCMPQAVVLGTDTGEGQSVAILENPEGLRVGVVAWTELMNRDGMHFEKPIVRGQDLSKSVVQDVKKRGGIDVLIGYFHGNEEQSFEPLKETRDTLLQMVGPDGFNVVVGHGPHVVHLSETVGHSDGTESFIAHSLGNFCSRYPAKGPRQTKVGALLELTVLKGAHTSVKYSMHLSEQKADGKISLVKQDDAAACAYPEVLERLGGLYI